MDDYVEEEIIDDKLAKPLKFDDDEPLNAD